MRERALSKELARARAKLALAVNARERATDRAAQISARSQEMVQAMRSAVRLLEENRADVALRVIRQFVADQKGVQ